MVTKEMAANNRPAILSIIRTQFGKLLRLLAWTELRALLVVAVLGSVLLLTLTACVGSGNTNGATEEPGKLSGPERVIAAVTRPPADKRCQFECPRRDPYPEMNSIASAYGCTLQDAVDALGPPEKLLVEAYGTDYMIFAGLRFLYFSKGLTLAGDYPHSSYPDSPPQPQRNKAIAYYYCYAPTTPDVYLDKIGGNKTLLTLEDWEGFQK